MMPEKHELLISLLSFHNGANCLCHLHVIAKQCSHHLCLCVIASLGLPAGLASLHERCLNCPGNRTMGYTYLLTGTQVAHQVKTAITDLSVFTLSLLEAFLHADCFLFAASSAVSHDQKCADMPCVLWSLPKDNAD